MRKDESGSHVQARTLFELRVGDVVLYERTDWLVEGVLVLEGGAHPVRLAHMTDGRRERWLATDRQEIVFLQAAAGERPPLPPPDPLPIAGEPFLLSSRGGGAVVRSGDCSPRSAESCRYWRYAGPLTLRAWVDDFPGSDLLVGEAVAEERLDLLPGS